MTPLHTTLKRALTIDGRDYVLTLNETALKLTLKGKRNGVELPWSQLVNGEAALAVALHASLGAFASKDKAPAAEGSPAAKESPPSAKSSPRVKPKRRTRAARKK
ncbi:MAG TPA: hypothetical protein VK693_06905 [Steroidobacteraceae bacterium]|nr:hypothetical protein [Steroidobacteraceae bacterium]